MKRFLFIITIFMLCLPSFPQTWKHMHTTDGDVYIMLKNDMSVVVSNNFKIKGISTPNISIISKTTTFETEEAHLGYYTPKKKLIYDTRNASCYIGQTTNSINFTNIDKIVKCFMLNGGYIRIKLYATNGIMDVMIPCLKNVNVKIIE